MFAYLNAINMYARLFARSDQNAVWLANKDIIPKLFTMVLAGASSDVPVFLPADGAAGRPFATLFGRPIIFIEHASTLGTVGDIALVDLSQYLMIDKGGIKSASFDPRPLHLRRIGIPLRLPMRRTAGLELGAYPVQGIGDAEPFVVLETR